MGHFYWEACAAVLLVVLWGVLSSTSCPAPCLCQGESLINCSSVGLSLVPLRPPVSVTTLDLSHNQLSSITPLIPLPRLTHLFVGHNQLTHLSLCGGCREGQNGTWAPRLELLSAERNQLQHIPECLGGAAFVQVLHLPHNKIYSLQPQDLQGCAHLKELHLQHNLISTLHHLAFRELKELKILDLSFNALNTIPTPAFLSLRSLNVQVDVSSNPWRCDCRLLGVRRAMGIDHDGPRPPWLVTCEEPSHVAGRNLLHLDDTDLTCDTPVEEAVSLQEVIVHLGAKILLPCSISDQGNDLNQALFEWWTPVGSSAQHSGGLLIREIRERDEGLYVCVWGANQEPASMFAVRVRRGAGGAEPGPRDKEKTSSELALAVCLSVFLTFIAAFALGALARPLLDVLWGKICTPRKPSATPTPCENLAGPEGEGPRESGVLGEASMPYYITVVSESAKSHAPQGHTGEKGASVYENIPSMSGASCSRGADQSGSSSEEEPPHPTHTVEFEPIPDPIPDLGIEDRSTTGSNQSNHDFNHDLGPDHDVGTNLGPDRERSQSPGTLPVSKEEFMAGSSNGTKLPGMEPFPVPEWTESPWEPCHSAAQATPSHMDSPPDGFPSALWNQPDSELWNDSGESFDFTDSLKDESTCASDQFLSTFSCTQQLKEEPWSPFDRSVPGEWEPGNDPWNNPAESLPEFSRSEQRSRSSNESSEETIDCTLNSEITALNPEITALNPEITVLDPEIIALNPEFTTQNPEITDLNPEIIAQNQEITALNPNIIALNPEITALKPNITELIPNIIALNPEITALNPKITALNPEITALKPDITALIPNIIALNSEITALKPEITALNPKITVLNTNITALNPEITALNPEITALNPNNTALNPEITVLNSDITELNPENTEHAEEPELKKSPHLMGRAAEAPWVMHTRAITEEYYVTGSADWAGSNPLTGGSNLGGAQHGELRNDSSFEETNVPPQQHPAPADQGPPYPLKPRRSFGPRPPLTPPPQEEVGESQGAWPVAETGQQNWRQGGLFSRRKRAMDTFATPSEPPSPTQHLATEHLYDVVTMEAASVVVNRVQGMPGELSDKEGHHDSDLHVTSTNSDPTSSFLLRTSQDEGSEA